VVLNRSGVRSDVGYLRRRVKPQPAAAAAQAAQAAPAQAAPARDAEPRRAPSAGLSLAPAPGGSAPSAGLSLGRAPAPAAAGRPAPAATPLRQGRTPVPVELLPFPAPGINEVSQLGETEPVLRLNARQSAVGSLIISGADLAVWEDDSRVTGSATAAGVTAGTPVRTRGNRPLVGFDAADAIVSLRHVQELRRALFIARGPEPLGVQLFTGATVTVAPGGNNRMFILCLARIGNLLELRAEPVDRSLSDAAIVHQFGFTLTPYVPPRESRSR
jgi:hypothetical protein